MSLPNHITALMQQFAAVDQEKAAAVAEAEATADLFDAAFIAHTNKLAALDPNYAAALAEAEKQAAFNDGFNEAMAHYGAQ